MGMTEEELSENMKQLLRETDAPPVAPREEMWARIQEERARRKAGGAETTEGGDVAPQSPSRDVIDLRPRRRSVVWAQVGAALAAMLVLGIGIGRSTRARPAVPEQVATTPSTPSGATSPEPTPSVSPASATAPETAPTPYRFAAADHMRRTETLLTSLRVDGTEQSTAEMQTWASELLTNTRLLLSSPAARDAETRKLLEDLELVLSQIAVMPATQADEEVKLIQDGLNQSDVLLRLRAATAGPRLVGT
jgi:hypothetical protein